MTTQILSPIELGETSKVGGRLFRKQILPVGSINYKGRRIDFTRDKLAEMEQAFRSRAFDTVPLVFADKDNTHTMDPRATTGEMVDVELTADGLDGIFRASDEAAKLLESYPKVGVSARILENYERADGRSFPAAIQHALITSDPRITGMRPWEAVNLSVEVESTLDLTAETFAPVGGQEEVEMAERSLTEDEIGRVVRAVIAQMQEGPEATAADPGAVEDEQDETPEGVEDGTSGSEQDDDVSDEELDRLIAGILAAEDGAEQEQPADQQQEEVAEPEPVAASNDTPATELANARAQELEVQLANMQRKLDERDFVAERTQLAEKYGIPPAVTDLARPLLEGRQVIELSNGNSVDAGRVVRDVFAALGEKIRLLDLSSAVGSAFETDKDKDETEDRNNWISKTRADLGL
jgi:hypothetical protein